MLPAMITSLAFPDRRILRVDLYPRVTGASNQYRATEQIQDHIILYLYPTSISATRELMLLAVLLVPSLCAQDSCTGLESAIVGRVVC